ncbi:Hydrogenase, large subunit-like protein [Desulfofarcimen acetoxidans DSM 771]|uniref:Hydrogenase, large subunit-like protein n=1 Tax=Desulfofarcimen acetoxidans (strain ATCC 49208 / DSM 771 / KCTC 5769 / VKM B-1644 / 5575) TaxID=485916 RepID=C8W240_DESAS|nr:NADH-quinone oxidoreductase subunit C [Desulfofarcimen acetoxidans]ACV61704.1 Hydrogenase, large subunit-like protein [Desulfofarcimen acetoxidans DSM 771]
MNTGVIWKELQDEQNCDILQFTTELAIRTIKLGVPAASFMETVKRLKAEGAYLLTMTGVDERDYNGHFSVYSVFGLPGDTTLVETKIVLNAENPTFTSISPVMPSAHWLEREIKDMLGIVPYGHPDLRRVAVHPDWPQDVFPMRKDFIAGRQVPRVQGEMQFCKVEGEGLYQVPVGPVHAGIIEPGHFRFFTFGEDVINLQAQLFYTHRGIEKTAEGKHFLDAVLVAERVCGVCSASHAVSYAQAIESLAGINAPLRARYIRTVLLEMERLYNHVGDIGNMCAGIGFSFGISRGAELKERLMRMNMKLAGHRYLRGTVVPGGVKIDLKDTEGIGRALDTVKRELKELTDTMLSSQSLLDRMQTTGVLPTDAARDLGATGPAARASGVNRDLRREFPYAAYRRVSFQVPIQHEGDVYCRLIQRIEESEQSFDIIRQVFNNLPAGELQAPITYLQPYHTAVGYTESARGANVHWVMSGPDNTVYRYMVRSASHCNWPVVPLCLPGNIVPDFPLINKSFELCYACLDR